MKVKNNSLLSHSDIFARVAKKQFSKTVLIY